MQPTQPAPTGSRPLNFIERLQQEIRIRGYSRSTLRIYTHAVSDFLCFFGPDATEYTASDVRKYLDHLVQRGIAVRSCNVALQAIKFFYTQVLRASLNEHIRTLKRPKHLPIVLAPQETKDLFAATKNRKHRLLLALAYGAGLRVSEAVGLRVGDLDFARNLLCVRRGKGRKDRNTIIPQSLVSDLRELIALRPAHEPLFVSERGGGLTVRTAQAVFYAALAAASVNKPASFHSLRHSFATHLIENGTDIRFIQELLGHENIRTTQGYTRVATHALARIVSPLDRGG